jgi:hypothetical protein
MKYVREPVICTDEAAIKRRICTALTERTVDAYLESVADIYELMAGLNEILRRERVTRFEFADLLDAARAAFPDISTDTADDATSQLRALLYLHREITADELNAWRVTEQPEPIEGRH